MSTLLISTPIAEVADFSQFKFGNYLKILRYTYNYSLSCRSCKF